MTPEGGHLFVQRAGELKTEMYPESALDYFSKLFDEQVTFKIDRPGRATELIHHENGATQRAKRIESRARRHTNGSRFTERIKWLRT